MAKKKTKRIGTCSSRRRSCCSPAASLLRGSVSAAPAARLPAAASFLRPAPSRRCSSLGQCPEVGGLFLPGRREHAGELARYLRRSSSERTEMGESSALELRRHRQWQPKSASSAGHFRCRPRRRPSSWPRRGGAMRQPRRARGAAVLSPGAAVALPTLGLAVALHHLLLRRVPRRSYRLVLRRVNVVSSEGDDGEVEARGEAMASRIWKRSRGITVILGGLVLKMIIIIGAVSRIKLPQNYSVLSQRHIFSVCYANVMFFQCPLINFA